MKTTLIVMLLALVGSADSFGQGNPPGTLNNRGSHFQIPENDLVRMQEYCRQQRLVNFGFDRADGSGEHCNFDCITSQMVCSRPAQIVRRRAPATRRHIRH